jgi:hypothetical protein
MKPRAARALSIRGQVWRIAMSRAISPSSIFLHESGLPADADLLQNVCRCDVLDVARGKYAMQFQFIEAKL